MSGKKAEYKPEVLYPIIDTHAHYDQHSFDEDRDQVVAELPGYMEGCRIVSVGASLQGAEDSLALAHRFPFVYAGIGIHPDEVGVLEEQEKGSAAGAAKELATGGIEAPVSENAVMYHLAEMAQDPRCVVYGEIGLDYYWMTCEKDIQKKWFIRQLDLAKQLHLPVNIHSREASQDTFDILMREHAPFAEGSPGVIHCYSGSPEMAREYIKRGYMLGIGGVLTFKNAKMLPEVVRQIPLEYLVTETDAPYLTPVPYRSRRNDSHYIPLVIEKIAEIKQIEPMEAAKALYENALRVYRWE